MKILTQDKKFVIIIPSYNNYDWCEQNIKSAINQNYKNYRIILTDDASTDKTFTKIFKIIKSSGKSKLVTLIKNGARIRAMNNIYNMIHCCDDDEIAVILDGDDWLINNNVLNKLNYYYSNNDIWMTYERYKYSVSEKPDLGVFNQIPYNDEYPQEIIDWNAFRDYGWLAAPLRTFYVWLFKKIKKEDLCDDNGDFFKATYDMAMMYPMLEMAGVHSKFISDIIYVYNIENTINTSISNIGGFQRSIEMHIRNMPKYQPL